MVVLVLQGVALVLQGITAFLALRLIRITGKYPAWLLLALAFALIVARRSIEYARLFYSAPNRVMTADRVIESVLLLIISVIELIGVSLIAPIFSTIKQSENAAHQFNTTLHERNRALIMLSSVNQALIRATDETALLEAVCRIIIDTGGFRFAWVGLVEHDEGKSIRPVAHAGEDGDYLAATRFSWSDETSWGRGPTGTAIRTGRPAVIPDLLSDPSFIPWREEALRHGYAAAIALPLAAEGESLGVLSLYSGQPTTFSDEEVKLLQEMAGDLAYGMRALRTRLAHRGAEEALGEQREFLRSVIDTVPNFIGVKDWESRFVLANRALAEVYGTTPEEIIGKSDADFNPNPAEVEWFHRDDQEVIRTCQPKYIPEEKVTDSTGRVRWLSTTKVPLIEEDGACSSLILATHDITIRKLAEETTKQERAFLASAIELLPFPILFISPGQAIIQQNRASTDLLAESDNRLWWGIQLQDPQTHAPIPQQEWPFTRALRGEAIPSMELRLVLPDGREMPILLQGAPVYVDDVLVAAVVAFQDISALKAADQAKNQFLMVLSHELKTPLTNIIGWVQLAEDAPDLMPEAMQTILRNAREQRAMLERLLILSRILAGRLDLSPQRLDLWQAAMAEVEAVRARADAHRIVLDMHPPPGPLPVNADLNLLRRAIGEVLANALKFTPVGGTVTVAGAPADGMAVLTVRDTGRGFASEQQAFLMHLFQQLQRLEEYGGIGIGLALVKGIVETHGGQVNITSPGVGQGSTVTLRLPRAAE